MADDNIPANDGEFDSFQKQFTSNAIGNPDRYGLASADVDKLKDSSAAWEKAYAAHIRAQADALTATQAKNDARASLEPALRAAVQKVHATAGSNNALRAEVGLSARAEGRSNIAAPKSRPLGRIELRGRSTFVIHFSDENTPQRTAKPDGVQGCQIWSFVGERAPSSPEEYAFLGLDTRTPYTDEHEPGDAGRIAHYLLRWQNAKGEPGPWSEVISSKIPA